MSRLKKVGIFFWSAIPLIYLASFKQMETDALDRAYTTKECQYQAYEYREKDYQKRYVEGYENGKEEGYGLAKIVAFNIIMEILAEIKGEDEEPQVKTANIETDINSL